MPTRYIINVAQHGRHFFATAETSIGDRFTLKTVLSVFMQKFPTSEGYELGVTATEKNAEHIPLRDALKGEAA